MNSGLEKALSSMILSASGWRGVFAENGDEESGTPEITEHHRMIACAAVKAFSRYLKSLGRNGGVICGRDTRPTGEAVARAVIGGLLAEGREAVYPGITAAPEIMAYAKSFDADRAAAGFIYISASHNPIGHNGLKFGLTDGGVLSGPEAEVLAGIFTEILHEENAAPPVQAAAIDHVLSTGPRYKDEAIKTYFDFTGEVITGCPDTEAAKGGGIIHSYRARPERTYKGEADKVLSEIAGGIRERPLGIAADFNGSARADSIDREFLTALGIRFKAINDKSGEIKHAIVPEGASLEPCADFLEEVRKTDASFILGYVPDCDGDRGNLVIHDHNENRPRVLEAQEVFALACIAELSYLVWKRDLKYDNNGKSLVKAAIAVNDPTSMRIDRIAQAFDVSLFRAEVGEANVVGLARRLREEGFLVRILGEGSNGGNITYPSSVRDPLNTIGSILKLLYLRSTGEKKGLYEIWCGLSGQAESYSEDFTLSDVIGSIPAFVSTGAFSGDAVIKIKTADHGILKDRYQEVFLKEWEEKKDELKNRLGIVEWDVTAYNSMVERRGLGRFGEAGKGGLKIGFINSEGRKTASLWMRGSATEPVFRIMADVEGSDRRLEKEMIEWQRRMILVADSHCGQ